MKQGAKTISPKMAEALAKIAALPQPSRAKVARQARRMMQLSQAMQKENSRPDS